MNITKQPKRTLVTIILTVLLISAAAVWAKSHSSAQKPPTNSDKQIVAGEHAQIGNVKEKRATHTSAPGAQWFPDAGLGLFLHWGISSVKAMNISHPMVVGRPLERKRISDPKEIKRIVREQDYYLNGQKPVITPNDYFKMAESFNPDNYHPEKWLAVVKATGFKYVVLTAKHHEGFAMWPSKYGNFNTKNYMGGRDLIKKFVDACHKLDIKVGLYFSGPDWHFDKDFMSFLRSRARKLNPELPRLGPDLLPRKTAHTEKEKEQHYKEYVRMANGQVRELLSNYGKIDVIWFDGKPSVPSRYRRNLITKEEIRRLQPDIVINPRMHGSGDYITFERHLPDNPDLPEEQWAEFCNPWNGTWPYTKRPYKPLDAILTDLIRCRTYGVNYLLGFGPMANGDLPPDAYKNMKKLKKWMDKNSEAIYGTRPLPKSEFADTMLGTAKGKCRYYFLLPKPKGFCLTLRRMPRAKSVILLADGKKLRYKQMGSRIMIDIPAGRRTEHYDVVKVTLE